MEKGLIVGALIALFLFRKPSTNMIPIKGNVGDGLIAVRNKYGVDYARKIEQLIRLETRHFKSGQWLKCGTAGMAVARDSSGNWKTNFPYGWNSLKTFCQRKGIPEGRFTYVTFNKASDGKKWLYVRFPETGLFIEFLADYIKNVRGGDIASWYRLKSDDPEIQAARSGYMNKLNSIKTYYV